MYINKQINKNLLQSIYENIGKDIFISKLNGYFVSDRGIHGFKLNLVLS